MITRVATSDWKEILATKGIIPVRRSMAKVEEYVPPEDLECPRGPAPGAARHRSVAAHQSYVSVSRM